MKKFTNRQANTIWLACDIALGKYKPTTWELKRIGRLRENVAEMLLHNKEESNK